MAIRLDEIAGLVSEVLTRTETLRMSRRSSSRGRVGGRRRRFPFHFGGGPSRRGVSFSRY